MAEYDFILLAVAVILVGCLYWRSWQRDRGKPWERPPPGHGIDVTGISDRVERVRHDYVTELQSRPQAGRRKALLVITRRAMGCLPYFGRNAARNNVSTERDATGHTA